MVSVRVQRGQKNFRLDIFARRIIMKIERDAATSGRPREISLVEKTQENRHLAEWRFSRFFIIIVTVKEPICKVIRMVSPPFGWCGRPPAVCAASSKRLYHTAQKSQALPAGRACCVYRLIAPSALCASASRGAHSDRKRSTCCAQRPV